jgi:hypothetical protein
MREIDAQTRWKFFPEGTMPSCEFLDVNKVPILLGDMITYQRRTKGRYEWDYETSKRVWGPSETQVVTAEVIKLTFKVDRANYSRRPRAMRCITAIDENRSIVSVYKIEKVLNLSGEMRQLADEVSKTSDTIQSLTHEVDAVFSVDSSQK